MTAVASIRITVAIRDSMICNAVEKAGINVRLNEILERKVELAEKLRILSLGGGKKAEAVQNDIKNVLEIINRLQQTANVVNYTDPFRRGGYITASFGGFKDTCNFSGHNGEHVSYCRIDKKFKTDVYKHRASEILLKGDHPLSLEWTNIQNDFEQLIYDKEKIASGIKAALISITTTKQLAERWPEAQELLPEDLAPPSTRNFPAVRTEELNALIGLPTEPAGDAT